MALPVVPAAHQGPDVGAVRGVGQYRLGLVVSGDQPQGHAQDATDVQDGFRLVPGRDQSHRVQPVPAKRHGDAGR